MKSEDNHASTEAGNRGQRLERAGSRGYFIELPPPSLDEDIDLLRLWRGLIGRKLMIAGITIVATAISVVVALMMQPVYRSEVLMVSASDEDSRNNFSALAGEFGGLASLAGVRLTDNNKTEHAVAVLRSRSFTEDFVVGEKLMPILFAEQWDRENNDWKDKRADAIPTLSDAFRLFDEKIRTVNIDEKTGIVTLGIEWFDRELAAKWANLIVARLNENLRQREIAEAEKSLEFLHGQLEQNSVIELQQGIFRLIEHQIELVMLANVREEFAFKILDPAVVADADQPVRPNRRLIVISIFMISFFVAIVLAVLRTSLEKRQEGME